jgi:hypothetical protein
VRVPGRGALDLGNNRADFNGTVQENAAGLALTTGRKFLSHSLRTVIIEDGPDGGHSRQGPFPDELGKEVLRQGILGHEMA